MKKVLCAIIALVIIAGFALFAMGSGSDSGATVTKTDGSSDAQSTTAPANKNTVVNMGETLDVDGLKITMDSAEVWKSSNQFAKPDSGNQFIRVHFTIKNDSGSDKFTGSADFDCYADGETVKDCYYGDDTLGYDTISTGRSTKGYVYYEVPKDAAEIELEYETSFWTDEKAIFKVELG